MILINSKQPLGNLILIGLISVLMVGIFNIQLLAAEPVDINNHWAQDYIVNLVNREIMELYEDNTFKPDKPITRGEFTRALARQMNLPPVNGSKFTDLAGYPDREFINALVGENIIKGYPDDTFRPEKEITRAETMAVLIRALGIKSEEEVIVLDNFRPFDDVSPEHWAVNQIKIAEKLNIIPRNEENKFNPDSFTTRASAARYIAQFANFRGNTGYLTDIYPTTQRVSINLLNGQREIYSFDENALIGRNNRLVELDDILDTDKVFIIADNNDQIRYAKAYGMVTEEDLATEVSKMSMGLLEPAEVKELSEGNLNILEPKLYEAVQNQLISEGLSREEVEAIMNTEWDRLEDLSKNRISETIAMQTGLPLDITSSLMAGDWEKIKTYAQIEIVQRMVQRILSSDLVS